MKPGILPLLCLLMAACGPLQVNDSQPEPRTSRSSTIEAGHASTSAHALEAAAADVAADEAASSGPQCDKGKPCGNTCIAAWKECHVGQGTATTVPAYTPPTRSAPRCKTGKPCGNSCISWSKKCRK